MQEGRRSWLEIIFPTQCVGCGFFSCTWWCQNCAAARSQEIIRQKIDWLPVYSVVSFSAAGVAAAIHAFKYRAVWDLADVFVDWLELVWCELVINYPHGLEIVLVPVPLHPRRLAERGFNQAELLAEKLLVWAIGDEAALIHVSSGHKISICSPQFIQRQYYTRPQAKSSAAARIEQTHATFVLGQLSKNGQQSLVASDKLYILIDDVVTTGSTLLACANLIRRAGARRIIAITVASARLTH